MHRQSHFFFPYPQRSKCMGRKNMAVLFSDLFDTFFLFKRNLPHIGNFVFPYFFHFSLSFHSLTFHKPGKKAFACNQFLIGSIFDYFPSIQNHNAVTLAYR